MRILIIADSIKNSGGAERSLRNIIKEFKKRGIDYKLITEETLNHFFVYLKHRLKFLDPINYIFLPSFIKQIRNYNPSFILCQRQLSFPAIIAGKITNTPVFNIIRDLSDYCPKYVNVVKYGVACRELWTKKKCYECINKWRILRIKIGNRDKSYLNSFSMFLHNIFYKIRYFFVKFNYFISRLCKNIVASDIMIRNLITNIPLKKIKKSIITPIKRGNSLPKFYGGIIKENLREFLFYQGVKLLFVCPNYDASHKGLEFIIRLSERIGRIGKIFIVGTEKDFKKKNIVSLGILKDKETLSMVYNKSNITLVPSVYTEAFGRVIIESIINSTPVICSNNCGAMEYVPKSYGVKVRINRNKWIFLINKMKNKGYTVLDTLVSDMLKEIFSEKNCVDELLKTIKEFINDDEK